MRIRDYGDRALLLECGSGDEVLALAAALRRGDIPGIGDIVPGARTVLVTLAGPGQQTALREHLACLDIPAPAERTESSHADVVIDVVYDGTDLTEVAALTGLTAGEVVEAHTGTPWRVGFGGFAPGFAYLVGGDPRLQVPRRAEPRVRVPAGSVALAGEFSGVYPRESPGGWQLIGRTGAALWDVDRPQPALLVPGMWVRFRAVASGPAEQP
ncbi:MAG TPA: allophanate hydrolase subunit 1 [Mycobacterium sp.]|uniref:5-oxoprolinase subunit B family protein n=1 Tax=Mycolicibacterium sp. TaxID=2320850 RepID=UPI0025D181FD|nr:allophanate hydrolase subunit 1 [Mycolicibacterium sp.]HPX38643.1 allophanate hydrolase subunit 1 [Mycobacterium sp.]HQC78488.1 allophanate hydrolase subunit 1 [Mycobacterium sp.]